MIYSFLKNYVAYNYSKKKESWGERALLFTKIDLGVFIGSLVSPMCMWLSYQLINNFHLYLLLVTIFSVPLQLLFGTKTKQYKEIIKIARNSENKVNSNLYFYNIIHYVIVIFCIWLTFKIIEVNL